MRTTRDVEPRLRRARLLAARQHPFWAIPVARSLPGTMMAVQRFGIT